MSTYVIGDIHGCAKTFIKLLDQIGLNQDDDLYLLGDYIDRGPDSKGVLDKILELQSTGFKVHALRGNHEQMMIDSVLDNTHLRLWLMNGGDEALASFGEEGIADLDPKYMNFVDRTEYFFEVGRYMVVHAGLNLTIKNPLTDIEHMLWSRKKFSKRYLDKTIIHGHTPIPLRDILKQKPDGRYINLDGGCVYENPGLGHLVGYRLETKEYFYLRNSE